MELTKPPSVAYRLALRAGYAMPSVKGSRKETE